ncbi:MAG: 50S ribosomal protein L4 [Candidatus Pacebacteria bacterium]|nr:50S ribosomal protein L4 [Candidatus Paceibacterota bacterium]
METKIYNIEGKETGKMTLPENIFGLTWNADLVHQVVISMQANARHSTAHTKTRGEVRGGGKKPWQQKGTGRARHGSSRSPIWKGGGVTHGPRSDKNYEVKINRAMRQKALLVTLSRKYKDGEVIFVDSLEMKAPKTAVAKAMMLALGKSFSGLNKARNAAYVALPSRNAHTLKSFANMGHVQAGSLADLNPVSMLEAKYLVIADPKAAIETLSKKLSTKAAGGTPAKATATKKAAAKK